MWKHCTFYCSLYDLFLNYEEELLDKKPCNENESESQGNESSSVESQESISRMSISISDEIETCINLEKRDN